jgi:hypothetical protein
LEENFGLDSQKVLLELIADYEKNGVNVNEAARLVRWLNVFLIITV